MKTTRFFILLSFCLLPLSLKAGDKMDKLGCEYDYTDASGLCIVNKLMPTENVWHRIDTGIYGVSMNKRQKQLSRSSTGLAVCFETDSPAIGVKVNFSRASDAICGSSLINVRGFDLYLEKDGEWLWAGSDTSARRNNVDQRVLLLKAAGSGMKKCLLYLPLYSELNSLEVITVKGSEIRGADAGFKGRIAVFGSSFTNGSGCSRPGLAYPAQLARMTGYNIINVGMSGNSKLQDYFARALADAPDIDAYLFDAFSNPSPEQIKERLFPFIELIRAAKPGVPLVFLKSVYREQRNFDSSAVERELARMNVADSLMRIAVKKYPDVYWIDCTKTVDGTHEWTTDGIHPDDYGYFLFARSVRKPVSRILRRYVK